MPSYLVSYDLRAPKRDYQPLHDYLGSLPYAVKPLESLWLVETQLTATELRDAIAKVVDGNDGIVVVRTRLPAAWRKLDVDGSELKGHFDSE